MATRRILVVDDEPRIRHLTRRYLEDDGFDVAEADSGEAALASAAVLLPDLVVLDVMLPGIDGVEVLRRLRARSDVPVIMLTARADEVDTLIGLSVGADDYVTKPFRPRELVARVKAVLRRERGVEERHDVRRAGDAEIDLAAREVRRGGRTVSLTALEFDLLAALASAPGRVFTRRQLLERVWGPDYYGDERVVDVHIRNLRRALGDRAEEPAVVATVRSVGYRAVPPE